MERTFAIIKPDAFKAGQAGRILQRIEDAGFRLAALRLQHLTKQEAESWEAAVVLGNHEAAAVLDRSENQIAQEKHRANKKFRRVI